jgi:hypothetical protein
VFEGRRDEIGIEGFLGSYFYLIVQPGLFVLRDPGPVLPCRGDKVSLCLLAVLSIAKATGMVQRPGDCAVIVVVFEPNPKDHGFSPERAFLKSLPHAFLYTDFADNTEKNGF